MATQYTSILKLALPVQGELSGTWGDVVNDNITSMVEEAIAGRAVINTWTANSHTLTTADGTTSESRAAILTLTDTGTALTGAGTVVCPAASKVYIVENGTGQTITVKTASGTGIAVPNTKNMVVFCDGTNVEEGITNINSLTLNGDGATVSSIKDEDNMASDSATALATQQSIKSYVDSQVGANNELSEVLANGNTTGGTDIAVSSGDDITFANSSKAIFGVGSDLLIYHDGSNSYISEAGTGSLRIRSNQIRLEAPDSQNMVIVTEDAGVQAFYNGTERFTVTNTGIDVTGVITTDGMTTSADINFGNNNKAVFGAGSDLQIYHDGSHSKIEDAGTGDLKFITNGSGFNFQKGSTENLANFAIDGAVTLYYDNAAKLATTATGIDVTGTVTADGATIAGTLELDSNNFDHTSATPQYNMIESDVTGNNTQFLQTAGDLRIRTVDDSLANPVERLRIDHATGAISFYEDTGTTEKLIWSASSERLTLKTSGAYALDVHASGTTSVTMAQFSNSAGSDKAYIALDATGAGKLVLLDGGNNEDVLIQAAGHSYYNTGGNFYFGKTSGDLSTDGVEARAVGLLGATRTSNPPLVLRRNTNDGEIASFYRDSNVIGNVGVTDGDLNIYSTAASHGGLRLGNGYVGPTNNAGTITDDAISLGLSGQRFTNLYLSDSVQNTGKDGSESVFNDGSTTADFRVESNGASHMLFVDAGANAVGIGTSAPLVPLHLTTSGAGEAVRIQSDDAGGAQGPILGLYRNSSSPVDGDNLGVINFYGEDSAGNITTYAAIDSETYDVSNGTEDGRLTLRTAVAGSLTSRIYMNFNETVVNEASADLDFRVESDNKQNMLFVDAGNDRVGVGTGVPETLFHVVETTAGAMATFESTSNNNSGGPNIRLWRNSASPADSDGLARLIFQGNNDAAERIDFAEIQTEIIDASDGTESGLFQLETYVDGTSRNRLRFNNTEGIINDGGRNLDFRVESDSNTHALFVDAGNDRVKINTTAGTAGNLVVVSNSSANAIQMLARPANDYAFLNFYNNAGTSQFGAIAGISSGMLFYDNAGTERFRIQNSQVVVNDPSNDIDFRVESDSNTHMLFVDASTGVMFGKSALNIGNAGVELREASSNYMTVSGDTVLGLNRLSSNGVILELRKDSSVLGQIMAEGGDSVVLQSPGASGTGLRFHPSRESVEPAQNNATVDNVIALGTDTRRYTKLHVSSGVQFGTAGAAAELLDDYEEGTYDVTITCGTSGTITLNSGFNRAQYTKVGRTVHVSGFLVVSAVSSPLGYFTMNLPFTPANLTDRAGDSTATLVIQDIVSANISDFMGTINETQALIYVQLGDNKTIQNDSAQQMKANSYIAFSATYAAA